MYLTKLLIRQCLGNKLCHPEGYEEYLTGKVIERADINKGG